MISKLFLNHTSIVLCIFLILLKYTKEDDGNGDNDEVKESNFKIEINIKNNNFEYNNNDNFITNITNTRKQMNKEMYDSELKHHDNMRYYNVNKK